MPPAPNTTTLAAPIAAYNCHFLALPFFFIMKLLFDLKFLTILYKNYQFETITFQNEIMTFQDLIIVRNLFYNHCTSYMIHFIFPFCKPFL